MSTNSNLTLPAAALAFRASSCTFSSITNRKVGKEIGKAGAKKVVGNDLVRQTILLGFKYDRLCQRSITALSEMDAEMIVTSWQGEVAGMPFTVGDFEQAVEEVRQSLTLSRDGENIATTDDAFEPLVVDGERVRGGRVYVGDNEKIKKGTLYLQGLLIHTEVLEKGEAPPPHKYREVRTALKDKIRRELPIGRYMSARLEPGGEWFLKVGSSAVLECGDKNLKIDARLLEE